MLPTVKDYILEKLDIIYLVSVATFRYAVTRPCDDLVHTKTWNNTDH